MLTSFLVGLVKPLNLSMFLKPHSGAAYPFNIWVSLFSQTLPVVGETPSIHVHKYKYIQNSWKTSSPAKSRAIYPDLNETINNTLCISQDPYSNLAKKYQGFLFGSRFAAAQWKPRWWNVVSALISLDMEELDRFWGLGLARWQAYPQA